MDVQRNIVARSKVFPLTSQPDTISLQENDFMAI